MAKIYNYDVMFDDTSIDVSKYIHMYRMPSGVMSLTHPKKKAQPTKNAKVLNLHLLSISTNTIEMIPLKKFTSVS